MPAIPTSTKSESIRAELKFLANRDEPLVYIPSKGGGDSTEHVGNFIMRAANLLQRRFAIVNVWRSTAGPVKNHPLVFCDAATVGPDELVSVERRSEERVGELQVALHNRSQRWYYYPEMQMDEAVLIKTFDSETDGRARFTLHSSCEIQGVSYGTPPRESIETRCLVFF